ncbi:uncharacterized protein PODANS_2_9120 [Podospora anserina S mat+]|uniref:Podospora anserina S mat+ genomic DNA chromosome 2, supercontig 2 n=1 Tax=Podospora anserina (strain S / ATCC MYA-4624 / DSM 980 / FGSC 10383) TaxID=515849 RepID=B2B6W5_PODAN|nr:uncharacterized protein PODANS_2_9120 [Podospora anserina S mat+]CAP73543.1 unnamed protein product [Podospora anserina S mat+]CDP25946.1 Putative protein of unknown function [Podospora anserina S mat+]
MLFDGSATELVRLLAVPVRPQNPPETASATPTQTRNGCCATKDMDGMKEHPNRKADTEVMTSSSQCHKRAKTQDGHNRADTDHSMINHSVTDSLVIDRPVTFSTLPPEVHRLIFTHIECIDDVFRLGLANRYLWSIGREHMHDYYMSFLGRWANEHIVCVGEDVKPGDYPPGLFSAQELDLLRQKTSDIPYDWDVDWDDVAFPNVPFTLHHFTFPSISTQEEDVSLFGKSLALAGLFHDLDISKDPAYDYIRSEMLVKQETYFPQDQQWILRNLTTKQFVRSEAIALKPECIHGPDISVLGFGEVVMSRICWSTSSFTSMSDTVDISRGTWAGLD